jgi:ElaB/YqjD/DUF883 family membrane-anchored ribosome-binding protein
MAKTKRTTQDEVQQLQKELHELESTVVKLSRSLRNDGVSKLEDVKDGANEAKLAAVEKWSMLRDKSAEGLHSTEDAVRERPVRSIGLAFLGGIIASRLLQR